MELYSHIFFYDRVTFKCPGLSLTHPVGLVGFEIQSSCLSLLDGYNKGLHDQAQLKTLNLTHALHSRESVQDFLFDITFLAICKVSMY